MKEISKEIIQFSDFLNASWPFIDLFFTKDSVVNEGLSNWLQANWEILVENAVCKNGEFLSVYGDGADFDDNEFSRVTYKFSLATHSIRVKKKQATIIDYYTKKNVENLDTYLFNQFVSINKSNNIVIGPKFDYVELENEEFNKIWVDKNELDYLMGFINKKGL